MSSEPPIDPAIAEDSEAYDADSIKVLRGWMLSAKGRACILVIPMMALACII